MWLSHWALFFSAFEIVRSDPLYVQFVVKPFRNVSSLDLVDLSVLVLGNELVNVHESSADSDQDLVSLLDLDINSLGPESVDSFAFSQKHDLEVFAIRNSIIKLVINPVCQSLVDPVILVSDKHFIVQSLSVSQVFVVLNQLFDFILQKLVL